MMVMILVLSFSVLQIASYASAQGVNVAINQNASQLDTLNWNNFNWTADKVVDNCTLRDDPDNQQSCSASVGTTDNFIRVDFDKPYNISNIVVFGRTDSTQTKDFRLSIVTGSGDQTEIYDNACCEYGDGIFTIPANDATVISIIVTRPTESILTMCEIQAFETIPVTMATTASTAAPTAGTVSDQGPNATSTQGQTTNSSQGQNATSTQGQTTNTGQSQNTTHNTGQSTTSGQVGDPNSVPGTFHCKEIITLLFLNTLIVWKYT